MQHDTQLLLVWRVQETPAKTTLVDEWDPGVDVVEVSAKHRLKGLIVR